MNDSKILICYNEPVRYYSNYIGKNYSSSEENIDLSESDFSKNIQIIVDSVKKNFYNVEVFPVGANIAKLVIYLTDNTPDVLFNFVESVEGNSHYECYMAGLYELIGIPYTGNSALALGNCLIKTRTKQILRANNIPTPNYAQIKHTGGKIKLDDFELQFPVIAKLLHEDASIGISEFSVIHNKKDLVDRLTFLFDNYKQDVLVEEYIEGRELNISILGDEILPISEIKFDGLPDNYPKIITYEAKWSPESIYYKNTNPCCPADLSETVANNVKNCALKAFNALGCRDYARVDIRLDKNNTPYVIEVNPNPDISIDSGFIRSAKAANISYDELLLRFANFALSRKHNDTKTTVG